MGFVVLDEKDHVYCITSGFNFACAVAEVVAAKGHTPRVVFWTEKTGGFLFESARQ